MKQDLQKVEHAHNHHRPHLQGLNDGSESFSELGQSLQSGNTSLAQSAYNSLFQDFQSISQSVDPAAALATSGATGVSVNA